MRHGKRIPSLVLYPVAWGLLILVLLILIEGAASWALAVRSVAFRESPDLHTRYDSLLGWSSEPGRVVEQAYGPGAPIRINSLGFRGEEIDPVAPEGRVRVVCTGDSFTFGQGVGNGQDWCHGLSRLHESLEPVNMGQPGYGVDQAYLWYMRDGLPVNPDVHVFAFVGGDFTRMLTTVRYGVGKPILRVSGGQLEVGNVPVPRLRHTIGRAIERAELRLVRLGSGLRRRVASDGNTDEVAAVRPVASLLFERLRDVNERRGIATILAYLPTEVDVRKDSDMLVMVESLAADLGLNLVDLTPVLRMLPAHEAAGMFLADGHYSVEGNRWVAEVLSERLRVLGVPGVSQPVAQRLKSASPLAHRPSGEAGESGAKQFIWHEALEVATGEARVGPWRMNESDWRYVDDASVALDEDGMAAVVWADQAQLDVFLQRYARDGEPQLDAPTNISRNAGTFSWLPRVLVAANDPNTLYVLWQEIIFSGGTHGGEILFARSQDGGRTFSEPLNLSNTRNGAGKGRLTARRWDNGSLDLAEGPDGEVWTAWTEYQGRLRISRSSDGGRTFSEPRHIAGSDDLPARAPSVAVDGDGRAHLAWTVGEDPAADIRYTVFDGQDESFEAPRTVEATEGHADAPKLAVGDSGIVHLVYAESPDGPRQRAHIRYTRTRAGERFLAPEDISGAQAEQFASVGFPSVAISGANLYVLWELFPDPGHRSRGLGIAGLTDDGNHFAGPEIVPHSGESDPGFNGSLQGMLMRKLAVNDAGDIAVVNSTFQEGERSLVRLIRGHLDTGTPTSAPRSGWNRQLTGKR